MHEGPSRGYGGLVWLLDYQVWLADSFWLGCLVFWLRRSGFSTGLGCWLGSGLGWLVMVLGVC